MTDDNKARAVDVRLEEHIEPENYGHAISLSSLRAWLDKREAEIPVELRPTAFLTCSTWDSDWELYLNYTRPETAKEQEARAAHDRHYRGLQELNERRQYEQLRAKFEVKP